MEPSQPKPHSLSDWQDRIKTLLAPVAHPRLGAILALAEELGECIQEVMALEIYQNKKDKGGLEKELADLQISLFETANAYDIDLSSVLEAKIEDLEKKVPGWSESFGENLARKRKQLD